MQASNIIIPGLRVIATLEGQIGSTTTTCNAGVGTTIGDTSANTITEAKVGDLFFVQANIKADPVTTPGNASLLIQTVEGGVVTARWMNNDFYLRNTFWSIFGGTSNWGLVNGIAEITEWGSTPSLYFRFRVQPTTQMQVNSASTRFKYWHLRQG